MAPLKDNKRPIVPGKKDFRSAVLRNEERERE
jgi:hypothetical protein